MKKLKKLELLKNQEPLIDSKELRSIIDGTDINRNKYNYFKGITMILSVGVILITGLLFFSENEKTTIEKSKSKEVTTEHLSDNSISQNTNERNKLHNLRKSYQKESIQKESLTAGNKATQVKKDIIYSNSKNTNSLSQLEYIDLSPEEASKLGIVIGKECTFITEEIRRIHSIPFKRDSSYRNSKRIQDYVKHSYDTTGKKFLFTRKFEIKIKGEDYLKYLDSMKNVTRTKREEWIVGNTDGNIISRNKSTYEQAWTINDLNFPNKVLNYKGRDINAHRKISPVWFSVKYRGFSARKYILSGAATYELHQDNYENSNVPAIDDIIPIRIKLGDDYIVEELIFYFMPNQELINALPGNISKKLDNELELLEKIQEGYPVEEVCKGIQEDTYFNICSLSSGSLTIGKLYPNPVLNEVTINFNLKENRKLSMNIINTSGMNIKRVFSEKEYTKGDYRVKINMSSLSNGIYYIDLRSDFNEQCSYRIIKY